MLFKKVTTVAKVQSSKLKGTLCNISNVNVDVTSLLLRTTIIKCLVIVKMKKKIEYRAQVLLKPLQTGFIIDLLNYVKSANHMYSRNIVPHNFQTC